MISTSSRPTRSSRSTHGFTTQVGERADERMRTRQVALPERPDDQHRHRHRRRRRGDGAAAGSPRPPSAGRRAPPPTALLVEAVARSRVTPSRIRNRSESASLPHRAPAIESRRARSGEQPGERQTVRLDELAQAPPRRSCSTSCDSAVIHGWYGTPRPSSQSPYRTFAPKPCAVRHAWATSVVLPMPGSPEINVTRRRCSLAADFCVVPRRSSSSARPKNANRLSADAPTNRAGSGNCPPATSVPRPAPTRPPRSAPGRAGPSTPGRRPRRTPGWRDGPP